MFADEMKLFVVFIYKDEHSYGKSYFEHWRPYIILHTDKISGWTDLLEFENENPEVVIFKMKQKTHTICFKLMCNQS